MLNEEISAVKNQPQEIRKLQKRELNKYYKDKNFIYLISSRYCGLFICHNEYQYIKESYELLSLNNNRYAFITIACSSNLAYKFENISFEYSLKFLDKAIETDEGTYKMYFLPHLYHVKGRLYYKEKDYNKALFYFNKAIENYVKRGGEDDILYIASMYNNIGMVYEKTNNIKLAIEKAQIGIDVLKKKKNRNWEEEYYLHFFYGYLASYLIENGNYPQAEKLLIDEWKFCKEREAYHHDAIISAQRLINIYNITGEKDKRDSIIGFLTGIESKLKSIPDRITTNEILQNHYVESEDFQNLKVISKRLEHLQHKHHTMSEENLKNLSETLFTNTIKKANEEYDRKNAKYKRRIWNLLIIGLVIVLFSIWVVINIRIQNKKEKELSEKQRLILEGNKKLLEQDIQLHKEKIKNLNLNLNLKIETEKAFLENLKKFRKSKNPDVEQLLKDLQFRINNLIQIDKKNYDFIDESYLENRLFMDKISTQFPFLSQQELKLCVYFKMNLSSKEISLLEDITPGSARVLKARIKSKIGLGKEERLNDFLSRVL